MKRNLATIATLLACTITAGTVKAQVIWSEDFEGTGINDGSFSITSTWGGTFSGADSSGNGELLNDTSDSSGWLNDPGNVTGNIFATLRNGSIREANTGQVFTDNTLYTLSFTHFRRNDLVGDEARVEITAADGTVLVGQTFASVSSVDTFVTRTIMWTTNGGTEIGQGIFIKAIDPDTEGNTIQAGYDNFSLSALAVPEPSTALLFLLGAAALIGLRRR